MPQGVSRGVVSGWGPGTVTKTAAEAAAPTHRWARDMLTTLRMFLLFIFIAPREVDSVIVPILLVRKLSLQEECDGGGAAGKCGLSFLSEPQALRGPST